MTSYILTILDTSGIQNYLFGTNNLKQNAGASYLADCATRQWVHEKLDEAVGKAAHNVLDFDDIERPFDETISIETDGVQAEVIYAGGGNTAILFREVEKAKTFATLLSRKVIVKAPELNLVIAHSDGFDWSQEPLGGASGVVPAVMKKLQRQKQSSPPPQPLRGLGVTVDGVFTYRPVVGYDTRERPVSAESWAKESIERAAEKRLLAFLSDSFDPTQFSIARDFAEIGGSHEESSYIAVVHADGNGMGERVQALQNSYSNAAQNGEYVKAMRAFSLSVQRAAHTALNATVNFLRQHIKPSKEADKNQYLLYKVADKIELTNDQSKSGRPYLPFRPIVFGGDDVTFVCEGRLGLQLAAYYLEQFTAQKLSDGGRAFCRAGIGVTHTHYPFALAYELAEGLCKSTKSSIAGWQDDPRHKKDGITAMDWHFAVNGMNEPLAETRHRAYVGDTGSLLMRPLRLTEPEIDWRSWEQFQTIIHTFQNTWLDQRNKLVGLREPLRRGPEAVSQYRHLYGLPELPPIGNYRNMATTGWQGGQCGYCDAIEALDFYVPLQGAAHQINGTNRANENEGT
ncbi:MAG: hypothetical protein R2932_03815 [Caldilineaceae bacterium]